MADDSTIRVTSATRDRLNRISSERGITAGELVDELIRRAEDHALLDATATHYDALKADPEAWAAYRAEIAAWDAAAGDGLGQSG